MKKSMAIVLAILALLVGVAIGGSVGVDSQSHTVVKTRTVTKNHTVYRTPASCAEALRLGDEIQGYASSALAIAGKAIQDVANGDLAAVDEDNAKMQALLVPLHQVKQKYLAAEKECVSASDI